MSLEEPTKNGRHYESLNLQSVVQTWLQKIYNEGLISEKYRRKKKQGMTVSVENIRTGERKEEWLNDRIKMTEWIWPNHDNDEHYLLNMTKK